MQIGAGWAKGMRLDVPKGVATRPTSARVRGAVLNALAGSLEGSRVADLFAGSGALGIEAVSRGAASALFAESAPAAAACLRRNVAELARRAEAQGLAAPDLRIEARDAVRVMEAYGATCAAGGAGRFDVIFCDPPYAQALDWVGRLAPVLLPVCAPDGRWVIECDAGDGEALAERSPGWECVWSRCYGDTMMTMLSPAGQRG